MIPMQPFSPLSFALILTTLQRKQFLLPLHWPELSSQKRNGILFFNIFRGIRGVHLQRHGNISTWKHWKAQLQSYTHVSLNQVWNGFSPLRFKGWWAYSGDVFSSRENPLSIESSLTRTRPSATCYDRKLKIRRLGLWPSTVLEPPLGLSSWGPRGTTLSWPGLLEAYWYRFQSWICS